LGRTARITEVTAEVTRRLCTLADPANQISVVRDYAPDWLDPDYWSDNPNLAGQFTGRRVYVFAAGEVHQGPADRQYDENRYRVVAVVLERYVGDPPGPDNAWLDERVAWVESQVLDRMGDARAVGDDAAVPSADPLTQEWVSVYAPDLLRQLNLFRSEVSALYRRVEDINA